MWPPDLLSTFCAALGPSIDILCVRENFREHSVNFPYVSTIYHHLYVPSRVHPSTFCASALPSINFRQLFVHLRELPSTFLASLRTSINFLCDRGTFCKLPSTLVHPRHLPSTSINFLCVRETFRKLPSIFCAFVGPSINCLCRSETFRQHPSNLST